MLKRVQHDTKMHKTAQVAKIFLTIFLFGALPLVIFTLITSKTGVIMGIRSFTVVSGSMQPTIPVGAIIFVQKAQTYGANDIIAFKNLAEQTVTHRVDQTLIKNGEIFFRTKGDANKVVDVEVVPAKSVIGKEVFFVPEIGKLSTQLKNPYFFIFLIITPTIIFILFELLNIKKEMEKEIEKKVRAQMGASSL